MTCLGDTNGLGRSKLLSVGPSSLYMFFVHTSKCLSFGYKQVSTIQLQDRTFESTT